MPRFFRADDLGSTAGFLSFAVLRRFLGLSSHFDFLSMLAWGDKCVLYDDFWGDTENLDLYVEAAISTGQTMAIPAVQAASGIYRQITGTSDNAGGVLAGQLIWLGDQNIILQARVRANIVTGLKIEVGVYDDAAAQDVEAVNAYDTPTFNTGVADVAVGIVDTDGTNGNRWALCTDGSTTNMNATATQSGEAVGAAATALTTAVASVYDVMTLTVIGDRARLYRNGKSLAHHGGATASQIEGGTLVAPILTGMTRNTTSKQVDWDYLIVAQDRS